MPLNLLLTAEDCATEEYKTFSFQSLYYLVTVDLVWVTHSALLSIYFDAQFLACLIQLIIGYLEFFKTVLVNVMSSA